MESNCNKHNCPFHILFYALSSEHLYDFTVPSRDSLECNAHFHTIIRDLKVNPYFLLFYITETIFNFLVPNVTRNIFKDEENTVEKSNSRSECWALAVIDNLRRHVPFCSCLHLEVSHNYTAIFSKWNQLVAHWFLVHLFQLLHMFRATICPSSGELTVSMRHWYFSICVDGCLICWLGWESKSQPANQTATHTERKIPVTHRYS